MALTVRESMVLELAGRHYRYPGVRETHARDLVGYGPVRFAQVVTALIERPDAEAEYPQLVRRLRRLRDVRRAARRASRVA